MEGDADEGGQTDVAQAGKLMAEMIEAEREVLRAMRDERAFSDDILREVEHELDLDDSRLRARIRLVIAAVLESDDHQRLYMGLSLLVSAAADGREARALLGFGALTAFFAPALADATSSTPSASRSRARSPSCATRRSSCARSTRARPRRRPPARTRHGSPASSPPRSSSRTRRARS